MAQNTKTINLDDVAAFTISGGAGDVLFKEDDTSSEMYVIVNGEIELSRRFGDESRCLAVLEPGEFFGETSLLDGGAREVTARARTEYRVLRLTKDVFGQLVREDPEIALRMLRRVSQRLRDRLDADVRAAAVAMAPLYSPTGSAAGTGVLVLSNGREYPLEGNTEWLVGRVDRASGSAPPIDLTDLDGDRLIGRRHALIVRIDGEYFVKEDRASRNGTFVNGVRVTPGQPVKLAHGDQVTFANVSTNFFLR